MIHLHHPNVVKFYESRPIRLWCTDSLFEHGCKFWAELTQLARSTSKRTSACFLAIGSAFPTCSGGRRFASDKYKVVLHRRR